jgi:hypothetical protein
LFIAIALMGEARNTRFCSKSLTGRDHLEDLGVDGRIILQCILKKGMDLANLALDRGKWRTVVNTEMNLTTP